MAYRDVLKPEVIPGLKVWKNPKNTFLVAMLNYRADPDKDPERNGKAWYDNERKGTSAADWEKEYEVDFATKSGKLIFGKDFCDFNPSTHLINSFEIDDAEFIFSLDFGQRNPTGVLVGAWTKDNILYIIDEYYQPALPSVSSREIFKKFDYIIGDSEGKTLREKRIMFDNAFQIKIIDPTTQSKNRSKIKDGEEIQYSVIEEFYDNGLDLEPGNNDWSQSIIRLREFMKVDEGGETRIYIFKDKCPNLCWELQHYRYKENTEVTDKTKNMSEEPVKKDDHLIDSLRYLIMTRPYTPEEEQKPLTKQQRHIQSIMQPPNWMNDFDSE